MPSQKKIVIFSNQDLTSSIIFSDLILKNFNVVSIFYSSTVMDKNKGRYSGALSLIKKMSIRYWLFLAFSGLVFDVFEYLTIKLKLNPIFGELISMRRLAELSDIPVHYSENFNDQNCLQAIQKYKPDIILSRADQIINKKLLSIPPLGVFGVHSSLLPSYGGIAAEFQAMRLGENSIATTVFHVTEEIDQGPSVRFGQLAIDYSKSLFYNIIANNKNAGVLLSNFLDDYFSTNFITKPVPDYIKASYFSWPKKSQVCEFRKKNLMLIHARNVYDIIRGRIFE